MVEQHFPSHKSTAPMSGLSPIQLQRSGGFNFLQLPYELQNYILSLFYQQFEILIHEGDPCCFRVSQYEGHFENFSPNPRIYILGGHDHLPKIHSSLCRVNGYVHDLAQRLFAQAFAKRLLVKVEYSYINPFYQCILKLPAKIRDMVHKLDLLTDKPIHTNIYSCLQYCLPAMTHLHLVIMKPHFYLSPPRNLEDALADVGIEDELVREGRYAPLSTQIEKLSNLQPGGKSEHVSKYLSAKFGPMLSSIEFARRNEHSHCMRVVYEILPDDVKVVSKRIDVHPSQVQYEQLMESLIADQQRLLGQ